MADNNQQTNPNQNNGQKPQNEQQKPGLSWSQPNANTNQQAKPIQNKPANTTATVASSNPDSSGRVIGIIVGIVVVFALAAWGIAAVHNHKTGSDTEAISTSTDETTTTMEASSTDDTGMTASDSTMQTGTTASMTAGTSATFSVASPQTAGTSISITNMSLSQPTWIVVYESNGGTPGNILGAGLFFSTDTSGTVQLLRTTVAGQSYLVTAAVDNGDKLFSIKDEMPVLDQTGKQVWITTQAN